MIETTAHWLVVGGAALAVILQTYFRLLQLGERRTKLETGIYPLMRGLLATTLVVATYYLVLSGWVMRETTIEGKIPGYLFLLLGLALRIWAQITLGRNWSVNIRLAQKHSLIKSGPYRYVRHPMYSAYALFALGALFLTFSRGMGSSSIFEIVVAHEIQKSLVDFWALFLILVALRAVMEDDALEEKFGPEYEEYAKRTGMFLPI